MFKLFKKKSKNYIQVPESNPLEKQMEENRRLLKKQLDDLESFLETHKKQ